MSTHFDPALWTIGLALCLGLIAYVLSNRLKFPPILFFLVFGLFFGPAGLGWLTPDALGDQFKTIISVGIAIILFEAGLTLDYSVYRQTSRTIWRLLTLGILITWFGNAIAIYYIFNLPFSFAIFASSLIIVTGPTVIMPILRKIKVNKRIFNILHWEGVLIDPIGVFLATLSLEILLYWSTIGGFSVGLNLFLRIFFGGVVGVGFGLIANQMIKRKWIPTEYINIFVLAIAIFIFAICDFFVSESGLLATIIAGVILGYQKNITTEEVKRFKLDITHLFIALLFIIIAASLEIDKIIAFGWKGIVLLLVIILLVRPISVFLSSRGSDLLMRERLFIAWVAPRGIVAASMSTLFSLYLVEDGQYKEIAWFAEALTFSVIVVTVVVQGFTASPVAKLLKVQAEENKEWIIVGAHEFSEVLYRYLDSKNYEVTILDSNSNRVDWFKKKGINALNRDVLSSNIYSDERFINSSCLISLTDNEDLNVLICQHWRNLVDSENLYFWQKSDEEELSHLSGTPAWQNLPKPSIIASEIIGNKAQLSEKNYLDVGEKEVPLLFSYKKKIHVTLPKDLLENREESQNISCLVFSRASFELKHFFNPELVLFHKDNQGDDIHLLYQEIANLLEKHERLDDQELLKEMLIKHDDGSIYIGRQAGIMHIYDRKINKPILGLVISEKGIDVKSYDGKLCQTLFILISPSGDPDKHLWIVSTISQLFSNSNIKSRLLECKNATEVLKVIETQK